MRTFIPDTHLLAPVPSKGDGRNVGEKFWEQDAYRTEQRIRIQLDPAKNNSNPLIGYSKDTGISRGMTVSNALPIGGPVIVHPAQAEASGETLKIGDVTREGNTIKIRVSGDESYPLLTSPGITYDLQIEVREERGFHFVKVKGGHDGFPAYEVLVMRKGWDKPQEVYSHDYRKTGDKIDKLFFGLDYLPNKEVLLEAER